MKILRIQDVINVTGLSRTTLWRLERRGDFPSRLRLGQNSCGWVAQEIQDWIASRPRGMTGGKRDGLVRPGPKADNRDNSKSHRAEQDRGQRSGT